VPNRSFSLLNAAAGTLSLSVLASAIRSVFSVGNNELLRKMLDYVIATFYPEIGMPS
jgi:hypothetical protein